MKRIFQGLIIFGLSSLLAVAQDQMFHEGDASFSGSISITKDTKLEGIEIRVSYDVTGGTGCGIDETGIYEAHIKELPNSLSNLMMQLALDHSFSHFWEHNKSSYLQFLICNKNFDYQNHRLYLRYNEFRKEDKKIQEDPCISKMRLAFVGNTWPWEDWMEESFSRAEDVDPLFVKIDNREPGNYSPNGKVAIIEDCYEYDFYFLPIEVTENPKNKYSDIWNWNRENAATKKNGTKMILWRAGKIYELVTNGKEWQRKEIQEYNQTVEATR